MCLRRSDPDLGRSIGLSRAVGAARDLFGVAGERHDVSLAYPTDWPRVLSKIDGSRLIWINDSDVPALQFMTVRLFLEEFQ